MRSVRHTVALATLTALLVTGVATPASAETRPQPGGRILYLAFDGSTAGPGSLKSARPDGRAPQDFGRQLSWYSWPDYSPDGRRIAYTSGFTINSMAADGTDDRFLGGSPYVPAFPRWSPNGRWVTAENGTGDIMAVHRDGYEAGLVNLTGQYDSNDLVPAWAPDGRRFATANYNGLRVYSADGSRGRDLVTLPSAYRLDWNPNGRTIAVEASGDLWLVTVASGAVRRLTDTPDIQETSPVWSPDGRWLAFGRGPGAHDQELPGFTVDPVIWLARADGTGAHATPIAGVPSSWRASS